MRIENRLMISVPRKMTPINSNCASIGRSVGTTRLHTQLFQTSVAGSHATAGSGVHSDQDFLLVLVSAPGSGASGSRFRRCSLGFCARLSSAAHPSPQHCRSTPRHPSRCLGFQGSPSHHRERPAAPGRRCERHRGLHTTTPLPWGKVSSRKSLQRIVMQSLKPAASTLARA